MNTARSKKLEHLKWAIESRAKNQQSALRLLRLFEEYEDKWKTKHWTSAAQELLSVTFSLWRAAFLADKTAKRAALFSHATDFLEKMIEDNAISYTQDRKCNEWTFNYYTWNASAALKTLHKSWPDQVPEYERQKRSPTERWRYCQELLNAAVERFETHLLEIARAIETERKSRAQARETRLAAKARRRKVREFTFASRKAL
jgi:hypothetical protein